MNRKPYRFNNISIRVGEKKILGRWTICETECIFVCKEKLPETMGRLFRITVSVDPDTLKPFSYGLHIPSSYDGFEDLQRKLHNKKETA